MGSKIRQQQRPLGLFQSIPFYGKRVYKIDRRHDLFLAIFAEFLGGTLCRSLGLIKESQDADPDVSDGETTPDARPPSSGQETGRRRSSIIDVARAILDKGSRTSSLISKTHLTL